MSYLSSSKRTVIVLAFAGVAGALLSTSAYANHGGGHGGGGHPGNGGAHHAGNGGHHFNGGGFNRRFAGNNGGKVFRFAGRPCFPGCRREPTHVVHWRGPAYRPVVAYGGPSYTPTYSGRSAAPDNSGAKKNPAPTPAASEDPSYVFVVFQSDATVADTAEFLKDYEVSIVDGPDKDGFYKLKPATKLSKDDIDKMIDSMRGQTKVVAKADT